MANTILTVPFVFSVWGVAPRKRAERRYFVHSKVDLELLALEELVPAFEWTKHHRYSDEPYQYIVYASNRNLYRRVFRSAGSGSPYEALSISDFIAECAGTPEHPHTKLDLDMDYPAKSQSYQLLSLPTFEALSKELREVASDDLFHSIDELRRSLSHYATFNGELYERADEPVYRVTTFGLGGNHGLGKGTHLTTSDEMGSDKGNPSVFPVTQLSEAIACAARVAERRGDTNALPMVPDEPVTVHLPGAVKFRAFRSEPQLSQDEWLSQDNGHTCPYCASAEIDCAGNVTVHASTAQQVARCYDCGHAWKKIFNLAGYRKIDDRESD